MRPTSQQNHSKGKQEPSHSARQVGLRYESDEKPGLGRKRSGKSFRFYNAKGKAIRDSATIRRIRSAIPPAWRNVWISPHANAHLQATGRDAKDRKQYRYHPRWREVRDAAKYENLIAFAKALPRIRRRVKRDLARRGMPREKALAAIVRLLESTLIRVGNDEYARDNNSFGLTTMRDRHVEVRGSKISFRFRGKSGIERDLELHSPQLAKVVKSCQDLPGQELFQYLDDKGRVVDVGSADVNDYLREVSGQSVSAKDFRTWAGTALAARALEEFEDFDTDARAKRNITKAIERVARRLGNTQSVCRKCYVHPAIIDSYLDRTLVKTLQRRTERELRRGLSELDPTEAAVLALLQERMKRELGSKGRRPTRKRR